MELNKTEQKIIGKIESVREQVAAFMQATITDYESRMSSGAIRMALGITDEQVSQTDFQLGLSLAVRKGVIPGFRGVKGKHGGYCPEGMGPAPKVKSESGPVPHVDLGNGAKLTSHDSMNWSLEGVGVTRYYGNLAQACTATAGHLLNEELRTITKNGVDLTELADMIAAAEARIAKRLQEKTSPSAPEITPIAAE